MASSASLSSGHNSLDQVCRLSKGGSLYAGRCSVHCRVLGLRIWYAIKAFGWCGTQERGGCLQAARGKAEVMRTLEAMMMSWQSGRDYSKYRWPSRPPNRFTCSFLATEVELQLPGITDMQGADSAMGISSVGLLSFPPSFRF